MKYCYKREEFEIYHFPTDNMTTESFTKPQQAKELFEFLDLIMCT